jgi:hypothetical protein
MKRIYFVAMKINSNGKIFKINHPALPAPAPTPPLQAPRLILENKKKKKP